MTPKGEHTRAQLLGAALTLFRERGYDATSMRDIAGRAGMSLGASYHYFASKEALVAAWYAEIQGQHEAAVAALPPTDGVGPRLRAILDLKLDLVLPERRLLGALFRFTADPEHPLSAFSPGSADVRARAMATLGRALDGARLPEDQRDLLLSALWMAHLGLLLHALHDASAAQARTRALAALAADLIGQAVTLAQGPMGAWLLGPLLTRLQGVLSIPDAAPESPAQEQA